MSLFESIPEIYLPLIIFISRILDVSMGTMRIIFINRGMKVAAASLGFFEVLIWISVVAEIIGNMTHWVNYFAYAGGFAAGNYLGISLEQKLKVGTQVFRIITRKKADSLMQTLSNLGFRATLLESKGKHGAEQVIFTVAKRREAKQLVRIIQEFDTDAFYSIEDVKFASETFIGDGEKQRTPFMQILSTRKGV